MFRALQARQRKKMEQRMEAPLQQLLQPGERLLIKAQAQSVIRIWPIAIQMFLVQMYLFTQGLEAKSWVQGLAIGLYVALTLRAYFLFRTDRRLLVVRLSGLSTKRWTFEGEIDADNLEAVVYEDRMFQDRLRVIPKAGKTKRFTVVPGWREEARRLTAPQRIERVGGVSSGDPETS